MSRSARQIPKAIAEFGAKQFKETGPQAVEVLRVKASTIRKHFRRLAGIAYLVAVISRDRVRVYFFDMAANMLLGENIEHSVYVKIRKTSRLITKYEKPHEPTPGELRMEATEEIRSLLVKSIKRVARLVARPIPSFPLIYVTRKTSSHGQNFGVNFADDGSILFEESAIRSQWINGIALRLGFLLQLDPGRRNSEIASCVANGVALSLLHDDTSSRWFEVWKQKSKDTLATVYVNHLIRHVSTYSGQGFRWLLSFLESAPPTLEWFQFNNSLQIIHDGIVVPLGTEEYHLIKGLCNVLSNPRKLGAKRHTLTSIHLAPRAIGNPVPLGQNLSITISSDTPNAKAWATVTYLSGSERHYLSISTTKGSTLQVMEYGLNLGDAIPKPGGIISHGKEVVNRALRSLGSEVPAESTFSKRIEFHDATLPADQRAVLDRLCQGGLTIIADSLVGSPQRIASLLEHGHLVFLPDFHHIGLTHDFLVIGDPSSVKSVVTKSAIEHTIFMTEDTAYGVVSSPSTWQSHLLNDCDEVGLRVYPILEAESSRGLLRTETLLPPNSEHLLWT